MNFKEAFEHLLNGKKIRAKHWPEKEFIVYTEGTTCVVDEHGFSVREIGLNAEWEFYIDKSNWVSFKDYPPQIGQFIAATRNFPDMYWIGTYQGVPTAEEDMFDYWYPLPQLH